MTITILLGFLISSGFKFFFPRYSPGGWIISWLLGVTGALVGHLVAMKTMVYHPSEFNVLLAALCGSVVILYVYSFLVKKTSQHNNRHQ